jgi:hypothetical protein
VDCVTRDRPLSDLIRRAQHQTRFRKSSGNSWLVGVQSVISRDRALWGFSWMILPQWSGAGDCSGARCRPLRTRCQFSVAAHPSPHPIGRRHPARAPRKTFRHRTRPLRPRLRQSGIHRMVCRLARPSAGWNGRREQRQFRVRAQFSQDPPRQQLPRRLRPRRPEIRCARRAGAVSPIHTIPFIHRDCISSTRNGSATAGNRRMDHGPLPN